MSLAEKWEEYKAPIVFINQDDEYLAKRSFYAGALAGIEESLREGSRPVSEIDHFKSKP